MPILNLVRRHWQLNSDCNKGMSGFCNAFRKISARDLKNEQQIFFNIVGHFPVNVWNLTIHQFSHCQVRFFFDLSLFTLSACLDVSLFEGFPVYESLSTVSRSIWCKCSICYSLIESSPKIYLINQIFFRERISTF